MSAAYDASDRRGGPGLGIAGPRTGDEWLRTRPIEEQLAEYARREAEDVAEAAPETEGRNRRLIKKPARIFGETAARRSFCFVR